MWEPGLSLEGLNLALRAFLLLSPKRLWQKCFRRQLSSKQSNETHDTALCCTSHANADVPLLFSLTRPLSRLSSVLPTPHCCTAGLFPPPLSRLHCASFDSTHAHLCPLVPRRLLVCSSLRLWSAGLQATFARSRSASASASFCSPWAT